MVYEVATIGDLSGGLRDVPWLPILPGWVPSGTLPIPGMPPPPVPTAPASSSSSSSSSSPHVLPVLLGVSVLAVVGAGVWYLARKESP